MIKLASTRVVEIATRFHCPIGGVGNTESRSLGGDCTTFFLPENDVRWLDEAIESMFRTYAKEDCLQGLL